MVLCGVHRARQPAICVERNRNKKQTSNVHFKVAIQRAREMKTEKQQVWCKGLCYPVSDA